MIAIEDRETHCPFCEKKIEEERWEKTKNDVRGIPVFHLCDCSSCFARTENGKEYWAVDFFPNRNNWGLHDRETFYRLLKLRGFE